MWGKMLDETGFGKSMTKRLVLVKDQEIRKMLKFFVWREA
jgi:hypothetical protein